MGGKEREGKEEKPKKECILKQILTNLILCYHFLKFACKVLLSRQYLSKDKEKINSSSISS